MSRSVLTCYTLSMKYFLANFKQHLTLSDLDSWLKHFCPAPNPDHRIILAPSFPFLSYLKEHSSYPLAAQNVSSYATGSFTGQVGVPQIQDLVDYCLLGHTEVRLHLGDTDKDVAAKARLLTNSSIIPIVCLDTPYLESQITLLKHELLDLSNLIFAYEPADAVGTGKPESPKRANEIAFKIKMLAGKTCPVLYGGSVTPENVASFLEQEYLDGFIVGTASLDPHNFAKIVSCD